MDNLTVTKSNRVDIYLEINEFDDISHEEISNLLELQPSKIFVKGKPYNLKMNRVAQRNRWLLNAYKDGDPRPIFEAQIDSLIELIRPRQNAFQLIGSKYKCEIKCAVLVYLGNGQSIPSVHLNSDQIKFLSSIHADFDVDIYVYS